MTRCGSQTCSRTGSSARASCLRRRCRSCEISRGPASSSSERSRSTQRRVASRRAARRSSKHCEGASVITTASCSSCTSGRSVTFWKSFTDGGRIQLGLSHQRPARMSGFVLHRHSGVQLERERGHAGHHVRGQWDRMTQVASDSLDGANGPQPGRSVNAFRSRILKVRKWRRSSVRMRSACRRSAVATMLASTIPMS